MEEVLHAGAIATTYGWPMGDREVEQVRGVSVVLRAMETLEHNADLWPVPRTKSRKLREEIAEPLSGAARGGQLVEVIDGTPFSVRLMDAVCEAWPDVTWALGKPGSMRGARAAYGFVGKRLVAVIAQMIDSPVPDDSDG